MAKHKPCTQKLEKIFRNCGFHKAFWTSCSVGTFCMIGLQAQSAVCVYWITVLLQYPCQCASFYFVYLAHCICSEHKHPRTGRELGFGSAGAKFACLFIVLLTKLESRGKHSDLGHQNLSLSTDIRKFLNSRQNPRISLLWHMPDERKQRHFSVVYDEQAGLYQNGETMTETMGKNEHQNIVRYPDVHRKRRLCLT